MIRWSTTIVVVLLSVVAAVVSYRHAYEVVTTYGESGLTALMVPLTIDGLIFASSMVLLDAARRGMPVPKLARFTLGLGILATLGANVATGLAHGPVGAVVAAWPAVALVLSYEMLMGIVRRATATVGNPTLATDASASVGVVTVVTSEDHLSAVADIEVRQAGVPPQISVSSGVKGDIATQDHGPDLPTVEVQPEYVPESDDPAYPLALSVFLSDITEGDVPSVRAIKSELSVGTDKARRLQSYLSNLVAVAQ